MDSPLQHSALSRRIFLKFSLGLGVAALLAPIAAASTIGQKRYRVVRGDSLSKISRKFGVEVQDIQKVNAMKGTQIMAGQTIVIPMKSAAPPAVLADVIASTRTAKVNRARWKYIVAHHSAIERGNAASYGAAHRRRGMTNGLAYHFVIGNGIDSPDGKIEVSPRWMKQIEGGHVRSDHVNQYGIGICLVGNLQNHAPTAKQWASFVLLVNFLQNNCTAQGCKLTVHKWVDRSHTLCPGRYFPYKKLTALQA